MDFTDSAGVVPSIRKSTLERYIIPVPPIEVQREIVHILDNFTELTAELTARQKQYEYYARHILDEAQADAPIVSIADLGNWSGGKTPSMANKRFWVDGTIPWISSKDMKNSILSDTEDHIAECAIEGASMKLFPKECIAVVTRSGILKHTFPIAFVPFETTVNQDIKMLIPAQSVLPKYAFFVLKANSEDIRTKCKKQGGTVDSLEFQKVLEYEIPLPDLAKQQQIVDILEHFEQLSSDLSSGLPAEIAARQKQYEYYRDKLMTFLPIHA